MSEKSSSPAPRLSAHMHVSSTAGSSAARRIRSRSRSPMDGGDQITETGAIAKLVNRAAWRNEQALKRLDSNLKKKLIEVKDNQVRNMADLQKLIDEIRDPPGGTDDERESFKAQLKEIDAIGRLQTKLNEAAVWLGKLHFSSFAKAFPLFREVEKEVDVFRVRAGLYGMDETYARDLDKLLRKMEDLPLTLTKMLSVVAGRLS